MQNAESLPQVHLQAGLDVKLGSGMGHPYTLERPLRAEFFHADRSGLMIDVRGIGDNGHLLLWAEADCGRCADILINLPLYVAASITLFEPVLTVAQQWIRVDMSLTHGSARISGVTPADLETWAKGSAALDATAVP